MRRKPALRPLGPTPINSEAHGCDCHVNILRVHEPTDRTKSPTAVINSKSEAKPENHGAYKDHHPVLDVNAEDRKLLNKPMSHPYGVLYGPPWIRKIRVNSRRYRINEEQHRF